MLVDEGYTLVSHVIRKASGSQPHSSAQHNTDCIYTKLPCIYSTPAPSSRLSSNPLLGDYGLYESSRQDRPFGTSFRPLRSVLFRNCLVLYPLRHLFPYTWHARLHRVRPSFFYIELVPRFADYFVHPLEDALLTLPQCPCVVLWYLDVRKSHFPGWQSTKLVQKGTSVFAEREDTQCHKLEFCVRGVGRFCAERAGESHEILSATACVFWYLQEDLVCKRCGQVG